MNDLLIDTNVLVYAIDEDSQFFTQARSLFDKNEFELCTTSKNLVEFLAVTTRAKIPALSIDDALGVVEDYIQTLTVFYPNEQSFTRFTELLSKYKPSGLRIHDFEILSIALVHQVNQVATFDIKDFSGIEEINLISV